MKNFKETFEGLINRFILFFLFMGMFTCYSQEIKFIIPETGLKESKEKGIIYTEKEKPIVKSLINTFRKTSKGLKKSADIQPPLLICPSNKQLPCGSLVPDYLNELIVSDDSGGDIYLTQSTGGTKFYDGMTIVFTAKDETGNESSCSIIITALTPDVTPPTFTCPTNITLNCGDVLPNYATNPMMNLEDDCSISISWEMTPAPGTPFYNGIPVQIKYTDPSGNSSFCNFNVTQANPDNIPPALTCLGNQIQNCGSFLADYRTLVTGYDNCLGNLTVSQYPIPGSIFTPGMIVILTVKDVSNNASTCSFIVNAATDSTKPIITNCPDNQTLAIGDVIPNYAGLLSITDNCDPNPVITQTPPAGTTFTAPVNVVLTAKDVSGNTTSCSFYINVLEGNLPPIITCPSGMELYANSTLPNYVSFLPAVSDDTTDNFDLVFTQTPPQGTLFTQDTNVTITVKDGSGNMNSCTFLVKLKTFKEDIDCKSASINVNNLYGANGFSIYGEILTREAGFSVNTAGDINGDGITDLIIGAPGSYSPWYGPSMIYKIIPGAAYVVFGKASGFSPNVDLGLLDGTNGFVIRNDIPSSNFPLTGYDVSSAGDINGDGIGDFMLSDPYRHSSYGPEAGHTYVIFGKNNGFPAEFKISSLDGSNGFTLIGNENFGAAGASIDTIGDINGDGFQDIAIITSGSGAGEGKCFIVYGKTSGFPAILRTFELNGTNGFTIEGNASIGKIGESVAGLGDVNGDGISDFALGSYNGTGQNRKYVIFGQSSNFPSNFNISALNGTNGFIVENSVMPLDSYNGVAKAGDLNNDGINDIAITGQYILFGKTSFPAKVDLNNLDGTNGFTINGLGSSNSFGYAGDFNDDNIDDYFIHTPGTTYVLYGKKIWNSTANTSDKHFRIESDFLYDYSASYAGDVNHDGISDLIIGNPYDGGFMNLKVNYNPGRSFVVFGKNTLDTEKPIITNCPQNEIVLTGFPIPDYRNTITVTDNCDSSPTVIQLPAPLTVFDGLSKDVTITVTDKSGNFSTCIFKISDNTDVEAPVITCLADQQLTCGSAVPDYLSLITVTDNMDVAPILSQNPVAGSAFINGMTITITAKDASNNQSYCSFKVNTSADLTKPVITCIADQTLSCGSTIPDYTTLVSVTDNCDSSPLLTQNPPAGTVFTAEMTITITAEDLSNNQSYCSFKINASADVTAPVITCIGDQTLSCGSIVPDYTPLVTATDNCDASPIITQNPPAGSVFTDGMIITMTAQDVSKNESYCSFKINASADVTKPVIICIADQNLNLGETLPDYRSMITATDNCDSNLIITQLPVAGTNVTDEMSITINVSDNSGNISSCSFKINVIQDNEPPVFTCLADQMFDCSVSIVPDYTKIISVTDNTDPNPVIVQTPAPGAPFVEGMTIYIKVSDKYNNHTECSFQLFTYPIFVDAGEDVEINEGQFVKLQAVALENGNFSWSPATGLNNNKVGNPIATPSETTTYTVVFTNKDGCQTEDSITITVIPVQKDETKYGFSPNNDGINDFWEIDGITDYPENEVLIYSRWGDLVYQTKGYNNATNVFSGIANKSRNLGANQLPEGTYFFEIRVNQPNHLKKLKGYLVLKR
ncbi:HYR domain-containing protein [Flavobacterium sp.]|uniref:HYR domain-containing protein n=1 Tax=Flavobacterium sp. TaxID=239 RepID=UPI0031DA07C8